MSVPSYNLVIPKLNFNTSLTGGFGSTNMYSNFANFNSFGGMNGFTFNTPIFNTGIQPSNTTKQTETWEERQARIAKENEKKRSEYKRLQDEIKKLENDKSVVEAKALVERAEKATVDPNSGAFIEKETMAEYKKQPFWKKALRAGGNMFHGILKLATDFVGYETDPQTGKNKINRKKCLKNVGIAAGCMALTCIPVVGKFIAIGLLATGVVSGAIGVGKGIVKACKAKKKKNASPEEIDKAFQEIGSGAFIGITSAIGLKGLGKGLSASHASSGVGRSMGNNAISQFCKDATVNAFRAAKQGASADLQLMAELQQAGKNGFWGTFRSNLPKLGKRSFDKDLKSVNDQIDAQIRDIDKAIYDGPATELDRQLLQLEKNSLVQCKADINGSGMTKADWQALTAKENTLKLSAQELRKLKVGDTFDVSKTYKIQVTKANQGMIRDVAANLDNFGTQTANLADARFRSLKLMAWNKNNAGEVEAYTGSSKITCRGRFWDLVKPAQGNGPLGTGWNYTKAGFGFVWNKVMGWSFKPWNMVQKSPASAWFKFESTVLNPTYEGSMIKSMLKMGDMPIVVTGEDGSQQAIDADYVNKLKDGIAQVEAKKKELKAKQDKIYA